jgi:hypothetical protein
MPSGQLASLTSLIAELIRAVRSFISRSLTQRVILSAREFGTALEGDVGEAELALDL